MRHGQKSTPQHAEQRTSVARSELRIKNRSARRAKNLRRKECDKDKKPVSTPSKEPPWQGVSKGQGSTHPHAKKTISGERMERRPTKNPPRSRTTHRGGTDGHEETEERNRKPSNPARGNGWTGGQRRTPQEAERRPLRGTDGAKDNEEPTWKRLR